MYRCGRLIKGMLFIQTWDGRLISLKVLAQANR
ncbi:hypothetical protein J2T18_001956 [Paenibacillus polymyxa]|nr:hypothetical protein [Paenibacillus polymyxa]